MNFKWHQKGNKTSLVNSGHFWGQNPKLQSLIEFFFSILTFRKSEINLQLNLSNLSFFFIQLTIFISIFVICEMLINIFASYFSSFVGFRCGSAGKESTCNVGDLGSIPGLGRSPGEGKGYPLQYSGLENSMDSPWGCKELDTTEQLSFFVSFEEEDSPYKIIFSQYMWPYTLTNMRKMRGWVDREPEDK